jgi:hypothetical protein
VRGSLVGGCRAPGRRGAPRTHGGSLAATRARISLSVSAWGSSVATEQPSGASSGLSAMRSNRQ